MSVKDYCVMCGSEGDDHPVILEGNSEMKVYNYDGNQVPTVCGDCKYKLEDDAYSDARIFYVGSTPQMALVYYCKDNMAVAIPQTHWDGFEGFRRNEPIDEIVENYVNNSISNKRSRISDLENINLDSGEISSLDISGDYIVVFNNSVKVYS